MTDPQESQPITPRPDGLDSTKRLLERAKAGDNVSRDALLRRFLPVLRRWAHGRLPVYARDLADTDDLVQITLVSALKHVETFEPKREGAFLAYLRRILLNRLRDEIRRVNRRGASQEIDDSIPGRLSSPLENLLGRETLETYERALDRLTEGQREAVVLRVEFGYSYAEVADATDAPSEAAARMLVVRGLARLAEEFGSAR